VEGRHRLKEKRRTKNDKLLKVTFLGPCNNLSFLMKRLPSSCDEILHTTIVRLKYYLFDIVKHGKASGVTNLRTYKMLATRACARTLVHTCLHFSFTRISRIVISGQNTASRCRTLLHVRNTSSGSLHSFVRYFLSIIWSCFGTDMGRGSTVKPRRHGFEGLLQSMQGCSETYNRHHVDCHYWSLLHHFVGTATKRIYRNIWNTLNASSFSTGRMVILPFSVELIQYSGESYQTKTGRTHGSEGKIKRLCKVKVMPQCYYCNRYFEYAVCPYDGSQLYSDTDQYTCSEGHSLLIPDQYRFVEQYTYRRTVAACPYCRTPYLYTDLPPEMKEQFNRARGARAPGGGCFIATAAYGTPLAPEINVLREWRDFKLRKSVGGRMFVKVYYVVSPSIALIIAKSEQLKYLTRKILTPIVGYFKRKYRKP
jgi:hypothetical protein